MGEVRGGCGGWVQLISERGKIYSFLLFVDQQVTNLLVSNRGFDPLTPLQTVFKFYPVAVTSSHEDVALFLLMPKILFI